MKKIKSMLLSLALLAVVGGTLAYKAKYIGFFCTTVARFAVTQYTCKDVAGNPLKCPHKDELVESRTPVNNYHCTTTPFINGAGLYTCTITTQNPNCLPTVVEVRVD